MADDNKGQRFSMSDIYQSLLSCSDKQTDLEKEVHVYDAKEVQNGWRLVNCNAKYIACPTRPEHTSNNSVKNDAKKRNKKDKGKENQENGRKYDKFKMVSYGVPSWRTIIDPETCTYVPRHHPCTNTASGFFKGGGFGGLSFVDPARVLDQHLGGFVQRQQARTVLYDHNNKPDPSDKEVNHYKVNHCIKPIEMYQMPLNDIQPPVDAEDKFSLSSIVTTDIPKVHALKPLPPATISKDDLQRSSITFTTKNLPPVLLPHKCPTMDRKTGRVHREVFHSQKIKLSPFKQPFTPVNFQVVRPNRKQNQKLNWLPITSTTLCLPRSPSVGQSEVRKTTWSKPMVLSHQQYN